MKHFKKIDETVKKYMKQFKKDETVGKIQIVEKVWINCESMEHLKLYRTFQLVRNSKYSMQQLK